SSRPTLSRREARTSGSRGPLSSGSAEVTSPCLRCELFIGPLRVGGTPAATLGFEGPGGYSAFPGEPIRTSTYVEVGGHPPAVARSSRVVRRCRGTQAVLHLPRRTRRSGDDRQHLPRHGSDRHQRSVLGRG